MSTKYKTLALDSAGELARLLFSWEMKKKATDLESIRQPQNFPGMTERLNIIARSLRNLRDYAGMNIVLLGHEDIQGVYAPGKSMIAQKGQPQAEPIAVRGWIDVPGRTAPQELERVVDQLFHMRYLNGQAVWIARKEVITADAYWDVKDRFDACSQKTGILPPSYTEVRELFKNHPNWQEQFIWAIYGPIGIGKTRCIHTFPHPIKVLDTDKGVASIRDQLKRYGGSITACIPGTKESFTWKEVETFPTPDNSPGPIDVFQFDSEDMACYMPLLSHIESCLK